MIDDLEIRPSRPGDAPGIERLYVAAFPDEDLSALVRDLLELGEGVMSLVGVRDEAIVGHIAFTFCQVEGGKGAVALLAPLCVTPALHKRRIGSRLVRAGFKRLENSRAGHVVVLGDPAYYGRFGFKPEDKLATPYPLAPQWRDAWQSVHLHGSETLPGGKLSVPEPWRQTALWTP